MAMDTYQVCSEGRPGHTLRRKLIYTVLGLAYLIWPLDAIPAPFYPLAVCDDAYMLYLLIGMWRSPTLSPGRPSYRSSKREVLQ